MKAKVIGNCMVVVAICVGIALPLAAWHNADAQAQARDESLRKQKKAIEELSTANANRRKEIPGRNADSLTNKQLNELLRLRAEASALRRETNYLGRAGAGSDATQIGLEAGRNLTPEEHAQRAQELSGELLDAARRIVAALPTAKRRFQEKQGTGEVPDFPDLRNYFPTVNGKRMPGLYTFGYIRMGGPKAGDNLVLLELGTHETADGKLARTFAFADGHAEEAVAPDRENVDDYFKSWVKANWGAAENPPSE